MGVAPLLGWRKTSPELFRKGFRWPVAGDGRRRPWPTSPSAGASASPPSSQVDPIYPGALGAALAKAAGVYPFICIALVAFNLVVVGQEFARGVSARQKRGGESVLASLFNLVAKSRRRYGGYIVHVGIAVMFVGFVGRGWSKDKEASDEPRATRCSFEEYTITYAGPRMEVDQEKRMIFADVDVTRDGKPVGRISPAQFIYKASGGEGRRGRWSPATSPCATTST